MNAVARRAKEVPALKRAVESGMITVSKAREIEREVAKVDPQPLKPERFDYVTDEVVRARFDIPESLLKKLRRIQDLESQRTAKAATVVETLEALVELYLERNAPERVEERQRDVVNPQGDDATQLVTGRVGRPSASRKRAVMARDGFRCMYEDENGRCSATRWLDVHHIVPLSDGGSNDPENLTTLCESHHRFTHEHLLVRAPSRAYGLSA